MKFSDFLVEDAVRPDLSAADQDGVIRELVASLVDAGQIASDEQEGVVQVVLHREQLGSTGIGRGVAVPHGKHPAVTSSMATIGLSGEGVAFKSLDRAATDVFFMVVSPPEDHTQHLTVLEHVSSLLRKPLFCKLLRQAKTPEDIRQLLREVDESDGDAFS